MQRHRVCRPAVRLSGSEPVRPPPRRGDMERARLLLQGGLLQGGRPLPRASKLGDDAASPGGAQAAPSITS